MTSDEMRQARKRLGFTQRQLAAELEMTVVSISNYENGHVPIRRTVELAVNSLRPTKSKSK